MYKEISIYTFCTENSLWYTRARAEIRELGDQICMLSFLEHIMLFSKQYLLRHIYSDPVRFSALMALSLLFLPLGHPVTVVVYTLLLHQSLGAGSFTHCLRFVKFRFISTLYRIRGLSLLENAYPFIHTIALKSQQPH